MTVKRRAATQTSEEHQELLTMIDLIERADAERAPALTDRAQLRDVSVTALMDELEIRPPDSV